VLVVLFFFSFLRCRVGSLGHGVWDLDLTMRIVDHIYLRAICQNRAVTFFWPLGSRSRPSISRTWYEKATASTG
jgi:hypothetical protein